MIARRAVLQAFAAAPLLHLARRTSPTPTGWEEIGPVDSGTVTAQRIYVAAGTDRDLTAALAAVPAGVTEAAVRIA